MAASRKIFCLKAALVAAPLVLFYGFPYVILSLSGEATSINDVIEMQTTGREQVLFGLAYSDPSIAYKLRSTQIRQPEILALGTSRVLQFRSEFFKQPERFYNAGRGVRNIYQYQSFLEQLPKTGNLKLLILGVDQWNFLANFSIASKQASNFDPGFPTERILRNKSTTIYRDYWERKFAIWQFMSPRSEQRKLGLRAYTHDSGFRNDGTYRYGQPTQDAMGGFKRSVEAINTGSHYFFSRSELAIDRIEVLDTFLATCKEQKIHVVVFLPPITSAMHDAIVEKHPATPYLRELPIQLEPIVESHGFSFFDFSNMAQFGSPDSEAIDGFHGSEKTYLRMLLRMTAKDEKLRAVVREEQELNHLLENAVSSTAVFQY